MQDKFKNGYCIVCVLVLSKIVKHDDDYQPFYFSFEISSAIGIDASNKCVFVSKSNL